MTDVRDVAAVAFTAFFYLLATTHCFLPFSVNSVLSVVQSLLLLVFYCFCLFTSYYSLSLSLDSRSKDLWNDECKGCCCRCFFCFCLFTSSYPLPLILDSRSKDLWNDGCKGCCCRCFYCFFLSPSYYPLLFALLRELCALCGSKSFALSLLLLLSIY